VRSTASPAPAQRRQDIDGLRFAAGFGASPRAGPAQDPTAPLPM